MGKSSDGKAYVITGTWNPNVNAFQALNEDTPKGDKLSLKISLLIQEKKTFSSTGDSLSSPNVEYTRFYKLQKVVSALFTYHMLHTFNLFENFYRN